MKNPHLLLIPVVLSTAIHSRAELVAHYKFDEPAATGTAQNEVAGATVGTVGTNVTSGVTGIAGNAYSFTGGTAQADIVDMGNASFFPAIFTSEEYTLSAWINSTEPDGGRNSVVSAGNDIDATPGNDYGDIGTTGIEPGHVGEAYARNRPNTNTNPYAAGFFSDGKVVVDGTWHLITMTVSLADAEVRLYVDGDLANTQTLGTGFVALPSFNNFEVGRLARTNPADGYLGLVDDVQVYDEALPPAAVAFLYDHPGEAYVDADTDDDGLDDAWEIFYFGDITLFTGSDIGPDADGATNLQEQTAGTDPNLADTDSDGRTDGEELNTPPLTDPLDPDSDDDGLSDGDEVNVHGSDPNNADGDSDGLPDGWEIANSLDPNSDVGDDGANGDPDSDGLANSGEYNLGDNSSDPNDPDSDDDGYTDLQEDRFGSWGGITFTGTDPNNPDSDGDGLLDGQENPDEAYVAGVTPGTDPNLFDTDGDGFSDKAEFDFGSDPTDIASFPDVARGLVAHYKFDESTGATTAINELGNSPGAVGSAVVTGLTGVAGNAYQLNNQFGQQDIVDMGVAEFLTDISATKALTFTAWVRSTDTSSGRNVAITASNDTLANSYVDLGIAGGGVETLGALSGRLRPDGNGNITEVFSTTPPNSILINDDQWHHVAMTIDLDTSTLRLFVDGSPAGENTAVASAVFPLFNNFEVGRLGRATPTDAYQGLIDDVQVYNEALAPARIAQLFAMPGVSADEDQDRLDDQWEIDNFGDITSQDGFGDPDGDGILNEEEETAGTPPVPVTTLETTSADFNASGDFVIEFIGSPNTSYQVTKSATLETFVPLTPALVTTTDASGNGVATIPASEASDSKEFYRIESQ